PAEELIRNSLRRFLQLPEAVLLKRIRHARAAIRRPGEELIRNSLRRFLQSSFPTSTKKKPREISGLRAKKLITESLLAAAEDQQARSTQTSQRERGRLRNEVQVEAFHRARVRRSARG